MLFICLMPAVFEEMFFRGAVLTSYEKICGSKKAIILCGLVFLR
ncbi:MAG: CPBP family intramembrane metalloprotease [Clostridiales bacterium]|nr:MAG: CPBP family intramembrane metalloprotease [Clostridiales bacterium]